MKLMIPHKALRLPVMMAAGPMDGKESDPITPEINDPVSFTVEGVVTGKSGDNCEVEVRFVNGERPEGSSKSKEEPEEKSEEDDLEAMAMKADEEESY